ncbi:MAG: TonB family protein [Archangium sp.]|nr:TonB family protein [Archangium sp.]
MKPARAVPPPIEPRPPSNDDVQPIVRPPPESESRSWVFLFAFLLLSGIGHVVTFVRLPDRPPLAMKDKPLDIEIKVIEPPKPPPEPEKPPEPEPPKPKPKLPPPPVKTAEVKPPPEQAPPPPTDEAPKEPPKPVPIVVGLSLSNTNEGGSFAAPVGNTAYGKAANTAVDPNAVQAYRAPKYVPPGGADTDPVAIGEVKVPYPEEARKAEVEGSVRMKVTVDEQGNVTNVVVVSGPGYGLNEAAAAAMKRFKFKPATKGGEAVGTTFPYTYTFLLD